MYLKDVNEGPAAKRALPSLLSEALAGARASHPHAGIVFKQGTYTFIELARWRDALNAFLMETKRAQWWGIDHAKNGIVIGVLAGADSEAIAAMAVELGIPAGALRFERTARERDEKTRRISGPCEGCTLQDSIRPVKGGLRLERPASSNSVYVCTLGFLALWGDPPWDSGDHAFVTNSHCGSQRWAPDSTKWYQNNAPLTHAESLSISSIGFEVADASTLCQDGLPCSYADAAIYRSTLGPGGWYFRRIARPVSGCMPSCDPPVLTIDVYYKIWVIVQTEPNISVGQLVNKIGQTTGWTQGYVRYINMTSTAPDGGHYLDQAYADYGDGDGERGAPVLLNIQGGTDTTVTLGGIHRSRTGDGAYAVFSPWSGILQMYPGLKVTLCGAVPC